MGAIEGSSQVGCQYFSVCAGGYQMLSFPCNAWFNKKCKARIEMLKVAKYKNIHIVSISKNEEEKEEAILSNSTKEETQMF